MSAKTANLSWYDLPEIRRATDALWNAVARQFHVAGLTDVPRRLNRHVHYVDQWTSPHFLFGQACGYDVRIAHAGRLRVVAAPCYDAPGCEGGRYSSFVVVREDAAFASLEDLRGARCVINTPTSHSGMNILRAMVAPLHCEGCFFAEVRVSGSHRQSLRMIRRCVVDVAAIDCVTYALLARHRPSELQGTRVLQCTARVPSPPYVTSASTPPEVWTRMRQAVVHALDDPSLAAAKKSLLLSGVELFSCEDYQPIESLETLAHGYEYREIPDRVQRRILKV